MPSINFLHRHSHFSDLIRIVAKEMSIEPALVGLKDGVLLEVGFDDVTPNQLKDISSWAYEYAIDKTSVIDNRAIAVACYNPGYTLVEKLQTISTKYRQQQAKGSFPVNFIRHYYDVYCLLQEETVLSFIGTPAYQEHKKKRFRTGDNQTIAMNEAFLLPAIAIRSEYEKAYRTTSRTIYYKEQPDFGDILNRIQKYAHQL